jgi:hypothetical protein
MNSDLVLFLPRTPLSESSGHISLEEIDMRMEALAPEHHLTRWHPLEVHVPYRCVEHIPLLFITSKGIWHACDDTLEKASMRMVKKRQTLVKAVKAEEDVTCGGDEALASARTLVRMAMWEADHAFPITPWRRVWRDALIENAGCLVVYLACQQKEQEERITADGRDDN